MRPKSAKAPEILGAGADFGRGNLEAVTTRLHVPESSA